MSWFHRSATSERSLARRRVVAYAWPYSVVLCGALAAQLLPKAATATRADLSALR